MMATIMNFYLFMEKYIYLGVESYLIIMIFLLLSSMFGEFAEKRILAFLVYFELSHLLCILLLLNFSLSGLGGLNLMELCTSSLLIIGSSGAETGVALALFMRYFRLTGRTTFVFAQKDRQPWHASVMFPGIQ
jgi:hypothetical protein